MAIGNQIGALRVVIGADTKGLDRGLQKAQGGLGNLRKAALPAVAAIAAVGTAATAVGVGLYRMARAEMQVIDTQLKLARSVEGTVTGLRSLKWAAEDSGVDGLEQSLTRLNRRLGAVEMGVGPAAATVERLGLNLKELAEVDVDERLARIADRIVESGVSAQEAARHLQNLGFQQAEAVQFFMQGGDAIRGAREEIEKYGLAVSELDARRMEEANNALARLGLISEGLRTRLTVALAPTIFDIATRLQAVAEVALEAVFGLDEVDDAATHLGGNKTILTFARSAGIAIAALIDAFDGLKGAMEALESFFKRWGYSAARSLMTPFRSVARAFEAIAPEYAKPIMEAFDDVDAGYKEHTERMKDGAKRFWSTFAGGEGAAVKAFKEAWDNVEIDLSTPSARTPGAPPTLPGGDGDKKKSDKLKSDLESRLAMVRSYLDDRFALETERAIDVYDALNELRAGDLIDNEEYYQAMLDTQSKFSDNLAELVDRQFDERRKKLEELEELEIISMQERMEDELELISEHEERLTEVAIGAYERRMMLLDEMREEAEIDDEEHRQRQLELEQEMQDELTLIAARAANQRAKLTQDEARQRMQITHNMMNNLVQLMNSGSKQMFAIGKVAAVANALLKGREAVVSAYAAGSKIGGPPLGAAYAATAAAATAAQVASVMNTSFGGGGTVSAKGGGVTASRPTDNISNNPLPAPPDAEPKHSKVTINLQGEVFSRQQVRNLIESINEAVADGSTLRLE